MQPAMSGGTAIRGVKPVRRGYFRCASSDYGLGRVLAPLSQQREEPNQAWPRIQQVMENLRDGGRRLAVRLLTGHSQEQLWRVLTDYESLHHFIPNLQNSRLLSRCGNDVRLEQVGRQRFCCLDFTARVELSLHEQPQEGRLLFAMAAGDFRRFEGSWHLEPVPADGNGTPRCWIRYELMVQGRVGMPIVLIEQQLQDNLANNVESVAAEASRRFTPAADS